MDDPVRLSADKFRAIYEQSFKVWAGLFQHVAENPSLPASYLSAQDAFREHPAFPQGLRLKHETIRNHTRIYATAFSTWGSAQANCSHELPPFPQQLQVAAASSRPISPSIAGTPAPESNYASWFRRRDENYLPILVLAWAYVLSARWVEIMPGPCSLTFTDSTAGCVQAHEQDRGPPVAARQPADQPTGTEVNLNIGACSPEEARWWAAILAPGQGWQATMTRGGHTMCSPWSVQLDSGPRFSLSGTAPLSSLHATTPPSFSRAIRFLDSFCVRHNVEDQSLAALAAVLLLPSMGGGQALQVPPPTISNRDGSSTAATLSPAARGHNGSRNGPPHDWLQKQSALDRLITLSCYTRGIRPMLLSVFYEPTIECNSVTPWLQGALAAIDSLAGHKPLVLGRMLMDRLPEVAFLWIGATILGLQTRLLQDVRYGLIPIDLHSAAWSGTVQSFIQQPVSDPLVADGHVSRADQCRLLFLSQSAPHNRVPVCQWKPFGATPLADTDVEIRAHAKCSGHALQYQGLRWDCIEDETAAPSAEPLGTRQPPNGPRRPELTTEKRSQISVLYGNLNRERESVSENATRNIFGWLRAEGYARDEKRIWEHQWFDILESDDKDDDPGESESCNAYRCRRCYMHTDDQDTICTGHRHSPARLIQDDCLSGRP